MKLKHLQEARLIHQHRFMTDLFADFYNPDGPSDLFLPDDLDLETVADALTQQFGQPRTAGRAGSRMLEWTVPLPEEIQLERAFYEAHVYLSVNSRKIEIFWN